MFFLGWSSHRSLLQKVVFNSILSILMRVLLWTVAYKSSSHVFRIKKSIFLFNIQKTVPAIYKMFNTAINRIYPRKWNHQILLCSFNENFDVSTFFKFCGELGSEVMFALLTHVIRLAVRRWFAYSRRWTYKRTRNHLNAEDFIDYSEHGPKIELFDKRWSENNVRDYLQIL